jgi:hypothetical protein
MRLLTDQVIEHFAVRALDLEAPTWTEGVFFDLLQQTAATETPHLQPAYFARDVNSRRWEGGHRCVSEIERGYEMRNLLPTHFKVKRKSFHGWPVRRT